MKSIREAGELRGKRVLLRVDFNVESATDAYKVERVLPTLQYLLESGAHVLVVSHRGRPAGVVQPELSLSFVLPLLDAKLGTKAALAPTLDEATALLATSPLVVLENVRFFAGEESCDAVFTAALARTADIFVNDAFAVSHRASSSVSEVAKLLPSYAGLLMSEEVAALSRLLAEPAQPLIVIIGGGGKAGEKFSVIKNLYARASYFLIGGVMANTFLRARGEAMRASQVDETILDDVSAYLHDPKIVLPTDEVWSDDGPEGKALDLGPISAQAYAALLATAKTVIWNGPMGLFEDPRYCAGSLAVAQAVVASGAFSVVGGGETTQFVQSTGLADKCSFLSTGGGAMLAYLAGKPMPGIAALESQNS
jgi:phosphoglycerate kinase